MLADVDRFRLLRPLRPPRCRVGRFLTCRIRGRLKVAGISDTPIQWPYANKGRPCLIVTASLARAVRSESATALCYWLGVTPQTVSKWRKALNVGHRTPGTTQRRQRWWTAGGVGKTARKAAEGVTMTPEGRARLSALKRGVPRPRHVIEAMRRGRLGKPHSEETKAKMRAAHAARRLVRQKDSGVL
jgi:hypothetical protein